MYNLNQDKKKDKKCRKNLLLIKKVVILHSQFSDKLYKGEVGEWLKPTVC